MIQIEFENICFFHCRNFSSLILKVHFGVDFFRRHFNIVFVQQYITILRFQSPRLGILCKNNGIWKSFLKHLHILELQKLKTWFFEVHFKKITRAFSLSALNFNDWSRKKPNWYKQFIKNYHSKKNVINCYLIVMDSF